MPHPAGHVGKYQTWSGGRSRNKGKVWAGDFVIFLSGKARQDRGNS